MVALLAYCRSVASTSVRGGRALLAVALGAAPSLPLRPAARTHTFPAAEALNRPS